MEKKKIQRRPPPENLALPHPPYLSKALEVKNEDVGQRPQTQLDAALLKLLAVRAAPGVIGGKLAKGNCQNSNQKLFQLALALLWLPLVVHRPQETFDCFYLLRFKLNALPYSFTFFFFLFRRRYLFKPHLHCSLFFFQINRQGVKKSPFERVPTAAHLFLFGVELKALRE